MSESPSTTVDQHGNPSEATLALLRAVQDLAAADDLIDLGQRGLELTRLLTGAGSAVLGILDETRPGQYAKVLVAGDAADDPDLVRAMLADRAEAVDLAADLVVASRPGGHLRLGGMGEPPTTRHRLAVQTVAAALGARGETLRQRELGALNTRVLDAVWEIDRVLADSVDLRVALPLLVRRTQDLTGAHAAALVGVTPDGSHRLLAAAGEAADTLLSDLGPDLDDALTDGRTHHWTERLEDSPLGDAEGVRSTSLVPLQSRRDDPVVLVVRRWQPPRGVRTRPLEDVINALALHASIVLDRAAAEREHDLVTRLEDRDRIARDLHDLVIQRLFAVGLTLQGASRRADSPELVERLEGAVGELDQTIRDIRATIFELRHHPGQGSFRADLRALVDSYTPTLGFAPTLHVLGPLDSVADDELHAQVLMVVREALSNVARHAHASRAEVTAQVDPGALVLTVQDDGVGVGADAVESGLANLRARAEDLGGRVELAPVDPHGTRLCWSAPLPG